MCPDLEVRYYIECHEKANNSRKRRSAIVCRAEAPTTTVTEETGSGDTEEQGSGEELQNALDEFADVEVIF